MENLPVSPDEALERTFAAMRQTMADPDAMAYLRARIEEVKTTPPPPVLTTAEFYAAFPD